MDGDERPWGYDTLRLQAVFVGDGERGSVAGTDITSAIGYAALKVPAVFVPEGANVARPFYPYVPIGSYVWRGESQYGRTRRVIGACATCHGSWVDQSGNRPGDSEGAVTVGPHVRSVPPLATLPARPVYADPAKTAAAAWRGLTTGAAQRWQRWRKGHHGATD